MRLICQESFYAWGAVRDTITGPPKTEYKFSGQRLDTSTGLLYYGARYDDPALRRWVQGDAVVPDPGNPQDLNRYAYVRDNPLRYTDPTGHWTFEEEPDTPGRFCPATRHTPAFRKVGYDVQSDRQATTGEALAIVTMPFWGAGAALGSVALGEVAAPVVLSPGFLLRGSVGGAGGLAGDLLGWWLAHGSHEGYDWPRALGVFVPNFFGGGLLGEVYPALPGSGQRVAAAALGNVVVGAAQRGLVGEPNSTEAVAVDAAYGVGGVFADRFFAATLRRYSGLGGASIEAISSFVSHPSMLSALHQGVLRFTGWVASHSPATSGEVWLP